VSVGAHRTVKKLEEENRTQDRKGEMAIDLTDEKNQDRAPFETMDEIQLEITPEHSFDFNEEFERVRELERTRGAMKVDAAMLSDTVEFLKNEGVDLSFLLQPSTPQPQPPQPWVENPVLKDPSKTPAQKIQAFIDDNAKFISELQRLQNERFSKGAAEKPGQKEVEIGRFFYLFIYLLLNFKIQRKEINC
jgi:hypothetical protein